MFPPSIQDLVRGLDSAELTRLLVSSTPLPTGKYLHWDQLRHRTPPDGLSSEQWWLGGCLARSGGMQALPLIDKGAQPFVLAMPAPVLAHLHHIDRDAAGQTRMPEVMPVHESR